MEKKILDSDIMMLQRPAEDLSPYLAYTGSDLKETIRGEYYNLNLGLQSDVITLDDRLTIVEQRVLDLDLKLDEYIYDTNQTITEIQQLDTQQSSAIRSLQDELKQFKNQSRAYATYAVRMKDPIDYPGTTVNPGDVTFNNDKWSLITKATIYKQDIEGKYFDYTSLNTGETLELVVFKEAGNPNIQNQLVTARASYTVTGVSAGSADPTTPVELTLSVISSSSQNDVTLGTEDGSGVEPDIVQFYVFPSFDPARYVTNEVFTERIEKIETDVGRNKLDIIDNALPAGTIVPYLGTTAPSGWFKCNGSTFNKDKHKKLYQVLGNSNVTPDLRGRWLVMGGSDGIASDVNKFVAESTKMPTNKFSTAGAGAHSHKYGSSSYGASAAGDHTKNANPDNYYTTSSVSDHTHNVTGGDSHTRPKSYTVNWIIRGG